jgi:hypothetical protein
MTVHDIVVYSVDMRSIGVHCADVYGVDVPGVRRAENMAFLQGIKLLFDGRLKKKYFFCIKNPYFSISFSRIIECRL